MKKIIFVATVALALCSCAKTELTGVEAGEMIIGASMEAYSSGTKAALADAGSFTWQTGDAIGVATSGGHSTFNLKTGAGTNSATFSAIYSGTLGNYAVYPADIFVSESKITIPTSRDWSEGNTNCSMFGSLTNGNVAFKHLGGVVKVTLNGVPAEAKKFVFSTPGKKITGEFDIQTETGENGNKYIATSDDNANSSYTLSFILNEAKDMAFYIPLPCGTYPKFAFKVLGAEDVVLNEFAGSSQQVVNRKDILIMPTLTIGTITGGGDDAEQGAISKTVPAGTKGNYRLPAAEKVILNFEGDANPAETDVVTLVYDGDSHLPTKLWLRVAAGKTVNVSGDLQYTTVEFDQGVIHNADFKTAQNTFKIIAPARIEEKLTVKGGNVEISGPIDGGDNVKAIEIVAGANADGTSAPVQITLENQATVGAPGQSGKSGITTRANVVIVNNTTQEVNVTVPTEVQETVQVASAGTGEVKRSDNQPTANSEAAIGTQNFFTLADAFASVREGQTIEITKAGTYTVPNISYNITVEGAVTDVVFNCEGSGSIASIPNGSTFKNVTMNFGNNGYHGFQHAGHIIMDGCILNGLFFSYGDMTFTNCTFNQTSEGYSMWCYAGNVTYKNCTINCKGKFANVYNEDNALTDGDGNRVPWKVVAEGCTFNSTNANKAALNIKATCGSTPLYYDVEIKNCTANGENWPAASTSESLVVGSPLWQVDDIKASVASKIKVTVDDTVVYTSPDIQEAE